MPMPIVIVDGGPAAVIVTLRVVLDSSTENGLKELPPTGTVPENESLVALMDGEVAEDDDDESESLAHAPAASAATTSRPNAKDLVTPALHAFLVSERWHAQDESKATTAASSSALTRCPMPG